MFLKNKIKISILALTVLTYCSHTISMEDESAESIFDSPLPDADIVENERQLRDINCIDPQVILDQLIDNNIPTLIENSQLYLRTNGVNVRPLLDYPILQPMWPDRGTGFDNGIGMQPFYNYMRKVYLTKNSPYLKCYIDLSQTDIVSELSQNDFLTNTDFGGILDLFQNIKLEERRAGFMLSYQKTFPDEAFIRIFAPILYVESNFYLTPEEQDAIDQNPFFQQFGGQDRNSVQNFLIQYVSCDRVGLGDTRLEFGYKIIDNDPTTVWLGFQSTIPTAFAVMKGVFAGACGKNCKCVPQFSLQELGELVLCPQPNLPEAKYQVQNFLLGVLGRLTCNVGNIQLGNSGHLGIGPQFDMLIEATESIDLYTRFVYEFMLPAEENRFFLIKKNPSAFDRDYTIEANASANLDFLSRQIVNTLYPAVLGVKVTPGAITKFREAVMVNSDYWRLILGFDYWAQAKEHIKKFKNSSCYEFEKAIKPSCYQGKAFGQYIYKLRGCRADGYLGIGTDVTFFNRGIGKDYTIELYVGMEF